MELRNLYYFLQLCTDKNYSVAAGKLFVTQQALSKSIKSLESELGAALFAKTATGIQLTPYGEAIYPICKDMLEHFEAGLHKIHSISVDGNAPIRIAISYQTSDSLSFTLLDDFRHEHPTIPIASDVLPDLPAEEAVLEGRADLVLSVGIPHKKALFSYVLIRPMPLCILVGPQHPLYHKQILSMQDLNGLTLHCAGPQFKTYHLLQRKAAEAGITLHQVPTSGHLYITYKTILSMNRAVIGIYGSQGEPELSGVRQIPFEDPELNWDIYLCRRKNYMLSSTEEEFWQYILRFARHLNENN